MTLVPLVNDQDEVIGSKERDQITLTDMNRGTGLWLTNSRGDILLTKRSLLKKHGPGKWCEAAGGTVEINETYENNIYKEIQEEIGLKLKNLTLGPKQIITNYHRFFMQWFVGTSDVTIAELTLQPEEVSEARWFSRAEFETLLKTSPEIFTVPLIISASSLLNL